MKKLPIGLSDFKKLVDGGYYYVDKTLLIRDILSGGEVILMPRPRRFGKTLNLSMLRYFLEKGDEPTDYLFENTKIWDYEEYRELQGASPVIFVTFKDVKEETWDMAYDKFSYILYEEFDRHNYLLKDPNIESYEKEIFLRILERRSTEVELKSSLHFLAKLLHKHFGKKPFLLIDEYDVPIQEAFIEGYSEKAIKFLKGLLGSVLKDGNSIEKGVVTGILTLTKAGIFTGLKKLIARASVDVKTKLEKLITGHEVSETIDKSIIFPELETRPDVLWSLLLYTGYLTYSEYTIKEGKVYA